MIILQGVTIHTCRKLALSLKPKIGEPEINLFWKILQSKIGLLTDSLKNFIEFSLKDILSFFDIRNLIYNKRIYRNRE